MEKARSTHSLQEVVSAFRFHMGGRRDDEGIIALVLLYDLVDAPAVGSKSWSDAADYITTGRGCRLGQRRLHKVRAGAHIVPASVEPGAHGDIAESWYLIDLKRCLDAAQAGEWLQAWLAVGGEQAELPDVTLHFMQTLFCIGERYFSVRRCVESKWNGLPAPEHARWRRRVRARH